MLCNVESNHFHIETEVDGRCSVELSKSDWTEAGSKRLTIDLSNILLQFVSMHKVLHSLIMLFPV